MSTTDDDGTTGAVEQGDAWSVLGPDGLTRCGWVGADEDYIRYHDEEWGVVKQDDHSLFEKLCLEGFQAGLSWITILRRRPAFRAAFHDFEVDRVAGMTGGDVDRLMQDRGIIRNRAKIEATISNARATLALEESLGELMWRFAPEETGRRHPSNRSEVPAVTPESTALSTELRRRGFRFVGPTTMYALMQATGMVDDHMATCWRVAGTVTSAARPASGPAAP